MKPEQKQMELERLRTILLATLDYLEQLFGGSIVYDQYDPVTDYYRQQKLQTEKYFKQRRLDRLQQRFASLTKGLQHKTDLAFAPYIKEKTGYDIDIFEDLRKRVNSVMVQNKIHSQKELNDIGTMLHFYQETKADGEEVEKLRMLLTDYSKRAKETSRKRKADYYEVVSSVEKDGIKEVTIRFSSGRKPKHFKEQEARSPDGNRRLRVVQSGDGKNSYTYVEVGFPTASGSVYTLSGIHPGVKAWWKDNSTIVIETGKEYEGQVQHFELRSFSDVVHIEYIEH